MKSGMSEYLQSLKNFITFCIQLFFVSTIAGIYIAINHTKETQEVLKFVSEMFSPAVNYSQSELFFFIFQNNVIALFISLVESIVFGISSIAMIIANGVIIGVFAVLVADKTSILHFILGILPHGIFELPAAIITSSMGMRIGSAVISKIMKKKVSIAYEIYNAIKCYILIVVPLLLVAAFVEAFITPVILSLA